MTMLHPFMGIENWNRTGLSVQESTRRLQRIGFLDRGMMRIEAGHMVARPEYELKGALGRMVWQDGYHYDQLRNRAKQLRMSTVAFEKCPDDALHQLIEVTLNSPSTLCLLSALFQIIKPAQVQAIKCYLHEAQPIVDEPTINLLHHQLIERSNQIQWGREALAYFKKNESQEVVHHAEKWGDYIQALVDATGQIDGLKQKKEVHMDVVVSVSPFELPEESTRDARFEKAVQKFKGIELEDNDEGRFKSMMFSRFFEMSPAEAVALVHFCTEGKPWGFYLDTAKHIWDEVRHAWFGEIALREKGYDIYAVPNWTGWYDMARKAFSVEKAYTHLTLAIEKAAMKYPPGKREEWEFCRDVIKDPLMTIFQDFDWADEVVHAGFGQKWIIQDIYKGDQKKAKQASDETMEKRAIFMDKYNS